MDVLNCSTEEKSRASELEAVPPSPGKCVHRHLHAIDHTYYFFHFNRRLLLTTLTLLSAIAPPAIIGLSRNPLKGNRIPAAIGIPMVL